MAAKKRPTKRVQRKRSALLTTEKRALGARVRERRAELGMSVRELAKGVCYPNHLYLIESGKYAPSTSTLRLLAERLGVSMDWLLGGRA